MNDSKLINDYISWCKNNDIYYGNIDVYPNNIIGPAHKKVLIKHGIICPETINYGTTSSTQNIITKKGRKLINHDSFENYNEHKKLKKQKTQELKILNEAILKSQKESNESVVDTNKNIIDNNKTTRTILWVTTAISIANLVVSATSMWIELNKKKEKDYLMIELISQESTKIKQIQYDSLKSKSNVQSDINMNVKVR
jgi:hypothetical protein